VSVLEVLLFACCFVVCCVFCCVGKCRHGSFQEELFLLLLLFFLFRKVSSWVGAWNIVVLCFCLL